MEIDGQYLEYDEYADIGGQLDEAPFTLLEYEARMNIDKYTYGRLKNFDEQNTQVKMCVYKLITILDSYKTIESQNKAIASESIDGYSVSYSSGNNSDMTKAKASEVKSVIEEYLSDCKLDDGTPYLYRG